MYTVVAYVIRATGGCSLCQNSHTLTHLHYRHYTNLRVLIVLLEVVFLISISIVKARDIKPSMTFGHSNANYHTGRTGLKNIYCDFIYRRSIPYPRIQPYDCCRYLPWRSGMYAPLKRWYPRTRLYGILSPPQNMHFHRRGNVKLQIWSENACGIDCTPHS